MKTPLKIVASVVVLAVCYTGYSFLQLRQDLFRVYSVADKYASADAGLIVVDFNRYTCDHCRLLHPVLMEAMRQDGKVRYIPRILTFRESWAEVLAMSVYAAAEQDKFIEMHDIIYKKWPVRKREEVFAYAKEIGLDVEKLSRDMTNPEIMERMREDQEFFNAWGLNRMPSLLIGQDGVYAPGEDTPTVEDLLKKFAEARS